MVSQTPVDRKEIESISFRKELPRDTQLPSWLYLLVQQLSVLYKSVRFIPDIMHAISTLEQENTDLKQRRYQDAEEICYVRQKLFSIEQESRQKIYTLEQKNETLYNCWQQANKNTAEAQRQDLLSKQRNKELEARIEALAIGREKQDLTLEQKVQTLQAEVVKSRLHLNPPMRKAG